MEQEIGRNEVEQAILNGWAVGVGENAASTQIDAVIGLLEAETSGDEEKLVKTWRVCRDALLIVYHDVERREVHCMLSCPCMRGERHGRWASYTAGCFDQECKSGNRLGGRLWDVVEFLRQHHGYESVRLVARNAVGALKTLSEEFRSKEENLLKAVESSSS